VENIDLSALLGEPGSRHVERISRLTIEDSTLSARLQDVVLSLSNVSGSLQVEFGFEFQARLQCARCLEPFWRRGSVRGSEDFELPRPGEAPSSRAPSERDAVLQGTCFDIAELARQIILTELPLVPYCRDDCAGLCPGCGANLNDGPCGCRRDGAGESPLAAAFRQAQAEKRRKSRRAPKP
jgi:uncharacterized metal-binding protein YceD (DUF177 family)